MSVSDDDLLAQASIQIRRPRSRFVRGAVGYRTQQFLAFILPAFLAPAMSALLGYSNAVVSAIVWIVVALSSLIAVGSVLFGRQWLSVPYLGWQKEPRPGDGLGGER